MQKNGIGEDMELGNNDEKLNIENTDTIDGMAYEQDTSSLISLDEINRALKLYGMQPLYAKDKRDACMIVAINSLKISVVRNRRYAGGTRLKKAFAR